MRFLYMQPDGEEFDPDLFMKADKAYQDYIQSVKASLPPEVYKFLQESWYIADEGRGEWHLHDMKFQEMLVVEHRLGGDGKIVSDVMLRLGNRNFNEASLRITYHNVQEYSITLKRGPNVEGEGKTHGNVDTHELILSASGRIIHEIEFHYAHLCIECADLTYIKEIIEP